MKKVGVQSHISQNSKRASTEVEGLRSGKIPRVSLDSPKQLDPSLAVAPVEVGFSSEFDYVLDEDIAELHRLQLDTNSQKILPQSHLTVLTGVLNAVERVSPTESNIQFTSKKGNHKVTLSDDWATITHRLRPGCKIQIVLEEAVEDLRLLRVDREKHFLIVEPDTLIPSTLLSDSFTCLRRCIISLRTQASIEDKRPTSSLLVGSIAHELVGQVLESGACDPKLLEHQTQQLIKENMINLHACKTELVEVQESLQTIRASLPAWSKRVFQTGAAVVEPSNKPESSIFNDPMITLKPALDIEESIWSRTFGIKGKIDATVLVEGKGKNGPYKVIAPFELKTGKSTTSVAHRAQTIAYTLALSDKYSVGDIYRIETSRRELVGIVQQRNRAVLALKDPFVLPPTVSNSHLCSTCFHKEYCLLYSELDPRPRQPRNSYLENMVISRPFMSSDSAKKQSFFEKWHRFVDLEEDCAVSEKQDLWCSDIEEKIKKGTCVSNLHLVSQEKQATSGMRRFKATFVPLEDMLDSGFAFAQISSGDPIVISSVSEGNYGLAIGFVEQIRCNSISVFMDRELKPALQPTSDFDSEYNHDFIASSKVAYRIDKDELTGSYGLMRANLIKLFAEECQSLCSVIVQDKLPNFSQNQVAIPHSLEDVYAGINQDQLEAIYKILNARDLCLVLGMPGTGKTTMLALVIALLVSCGKRVLISSYTHSAVDNVLEKLAKEPYSSIVAHVLRLGDCERVSKKIPREWILGERAFESLSQVEQTYQEAQVVATTCLGINHPLFLQIRFDYVFVDEASQVSLPACLGPLRFGEHFVLIGDHHQLPPLVKSRQAIQEGLATSLFEYLAVKYPDAIAYLTIQYRMNKPIMEVANKLMYCGRLKAANELIETQRLSSFDVEEQESGWIKQVLGMAVAFVDTDAVCGICGETRVGSSFSNPQEAEMVEAYVEALRRHAEDASVGVISLYRPQTAHLQERLQGRAEVSTVDQYQGRDRDCIVVSLVRSNPEGHVGELMSHMNRINVAFTRARLQLVIFGSCRLVANFCNSSSDPRWSSFWTHIKESGLIIKVDC